MGNTIQKWKTAFYSAKNAVFGFWPKIQKLTPLYYSEKFWKFRIRSRICNILPNGAFQRAKRLFLGIFWPKMVILLMKPTSEELFLLVFLWVATATGAGDIFSFWPFLAIFGHFWLIFVFFWFQPKILKLTPLCYSEKILIFRIRSRISNTLPNGVLRIAKRHFLGFSGRKWLFWQWGSPKKKPQKCRFALRKAPFGNILQIRLPILKIQIFSL